jgi:type IV secretory pathway TraG/TraD family ATPase VirD4
MDIIGQFLSVILALFALLWVLNRIMVLPFRMNPREWFRPAAAGTTTMFEIAFTAVRAVLRFFFPETFGLGRTSARFLGAGERRKLLNAGNAGLVLDGDQARLSASDSFRNCLVVATTGGGKTSSFIIPNILRLDRASIVITDPSGALYEKTSGDLRSRGFEVLCLDPLRLDRSVRYNPLATADTQRAIGETSHILSRSANLSGDKFWTDGAEDIITILIRCLKRHPNPEYCNLANVQYLLNNFVDGSGIADFVAKYADEPTYQQFKGFVSSAENTMQGFVSTAKTSLKALFDPDLAELTARNTFEFADLRSKKTALFLIIPQNRISYYAFLMNLFYTNLFHYCLEDTHITDKSLPVYFLLDEFGHLTIPDFPSIITTTRARRISISIILQSLSQLEARYGRYDAHTIVNGGVATRMFFSGLDIETTEMLQKVLGVRRREIVDTEDRRHIKDDNLLDAADIRAMRDDEALCLFANKRPMKLRVVPYFRQGDMLRRTSRPAFTPPATMTTGVRYVPLR